jgi:hypothetical protein
MVCLSLTAEALRAWSKYFLIKDCSELSVLAFLCGNCLRGSNIVRRGVGVKFRLTAQRAFE